MKRTIVLLLALALVLTALPCGVFADETDQYFAGKGTKDEPYLIQTPADLATLVYLTTDYDNGYYDTSADYTIPGTTTVWPASGAFGKAGYYSGRYNGVSPIRYYKMTADLDMTGYDFNRGGICAGSNLEFRGSFDGDGHVIKNWTSTSSGNSTTNGIFGQAGIGNVPGQGIRNVRVENASVTSGGQFCGVLVGTLSLLQGVESEAEQTGIENCYVKNSGAMAKNFDKNGANAAGGIVGLVQVIGAEKTGTIYKTNISNCYAYDISVGFFDASTDTYIRTDGYVGGIIGRGYTDWAATAIKLAVSNCYSVGDVTGGRKLGIYGWLPTHSTKPNYVYTFSNCYYPDDDTVSTWTDENGTNGKALTASVLGSAFMDDILGLNGGAPVFTGEYTYITNTLAATENGTLDVAEETGLVKKSGNTVYIKTGADLTVTAEPSENYTLSAIKYGGEDKTSAFGISGSAKFAFSDLTENGVWSAEFKENAAEPSITADKTVTVTTYGEDAVPAAVAYAKFSGLNPFEYGMVITRTSDGKALTLKAADNKNGAYAIKVYGEGVNEGNFTMKPYYVADEGSSAAYGDETDSFTLE